MDDLNECAKISANERKKLRKKKRRLDNKIKCIQDKKKEISLRLKM